MLRGARLPPRRALAQLRVEITGVGSQQFPIAIAPFAREGQVPVEIESVVRADSRGGACSASSTRVPRRSPRTPPSRCLTGKRGAPMRTRDRGSATRLADGRFDSLPPARHDPAGPARRAVVREPGVRPAPDGAAHRPIASTRSSARASAACSRPASRTFVQTSRNSWSCTSPTPTARTRSRLCARASRIISPAWSPRHTTGLRVVRDRQARGVTCTRWRTRAARRSRTSAAPNSAHGLVARWQDARGHADPRKATRRCS